VGLLVLETLVDAKTTLVPHLQGEAQGYFANLINSRNAGPGKEKALLPTVKQGDNVLATDCNKS